MVIDYEMKEISHSHLNIRRIKPENVFQKEVKSSSFLNNVGMTIKNMKGVLNYA